MWFVRFQILRTAEEHPKSGATFLFSHKAGVESDINELLKYFGTR